ncbi:RING finger domain and kelch repeat-containing protein DDB_G0271372-like isoform X2 [Dreissena polymorpha]|uniref:RING finger domain and kelch repeat-containing protein DDB_G0271372-like isoform X2 n=1 Tax=Dreissena polymorpha TaxID=45954 RepID=UPI002264406B|nr:RING finger domain and kelch repeat-containing protein DDB_G0271372-like isoform X2 [Dreissena polymorpha]
MESSINIGSKSFFDFSCFRCQENDRNTEAEFYCEDCSKFYCSKCVDYHNSFYTKHALLGKKNISQWPESNVSQLEQCQKHKKEKLTGFCEDHSELICHACHVHNHQKCSHVVLIADKVKDLHQKGDFKQLSETFDTQYQQLIHKKNDLEENMKSIEKSYKKILEEINALRKTINDALDQLEKYTKKELDTLLETTRKSIQTDKENCTESIKNITCLKEDWRRINGKSESLNFIKYRKCIVHSIKVEAVLQEMTKKNEIQLIFKPDTTIQTNLSTLSGLGQIFSSVKQFKPSHRITENLVTRQNKPEASSQSDPENRTTSILKKKIPKPDPSSSRKYTPGNQTSDLTKSGQVSDPVSSSSDQLVQGYQPGAVSKPDQIIKVTNDKRYTVLIKGDEKTCKISVICETSSGELLITDFNNKKVKLLDQTYKVVTHCDLPSTPWSMCSIDSNLVAVAMSNKDVHFISVSNGQLIQDRILKLQHFCRGIAHQDGNLYMADGKALYLYTVDGRLVREMYNKTSVTSCAVSPDGDRIYVINPNSNQLVTLSREGTVISTLTVPALRSPIGVLPGLQVHVTDSGQVMVCGYWSSTIIQMDRDGRQRLAQVVTEDDGVTGPISVFYSKPTGSIIVGMMNNNDIIVFKALLE